MNRRHVTQRFRRGDSIAEIAKYHGVKPAVIEEALRSYWNEITDAGRISRSFRRRSQRQFHNQILYDHPTPCKFPVFACKCPAGDGSPA